MSQTINNNNNNKTRLFVSGLYDGITDQTIRNHFEPFGTITDLYILRNKQKKSRGCCFIGFLNKSQASNALKQCNKTYIGTRRIIVQFALDKTQKHKPSPHKKRIAPSSNFNSNLTHNNTHDNKNDKEYQQFLRLTKSAANINKSTDDFVNNFLDDSDDSDSDVINDINDVNVKQVKDHNIDIKHKIGNKSTDPKNQIIQNKKVTEIFIRNLPFITTDSDLFKFFNEFGNILQVFIPVDDFGKGKGYAFVEFESNECIQKLFKKYQETIKNDTNPIISCIFNGRNVNILLSNYKYKETYCIDGKEICYNDLDDELKSNLSFKQLRYLKLKHNATNQKTWNTFFIPTDNILRYNASKLNVTKSDLLGVSNENNKNNMAVTTTLAETSVISKTKTFLSENGIDINKFNHDKKVTVRSRNIILIKNFPFNTTANELKGFFKKYGQIARFLLPETKACAIVEFMNVKDAQNAFHELSYSKFKHLPLFLEWAPINLFNEEYNIKKKDVDDGEDVVVEDDNEKRRKKKRKLSDVDDNKTKVIVKNIPFETQKNELLKLFGVYGRIKSLRLPRKYGGGHRGFCFIEFDTNKEALNVFDALSASHFYGRHLVIEWANNNTTDAKRTRIE